MRLACSGSLLDSGFQDFEFRSKVSQSQGNIVKHEQKVINILGYICLKFGVSVLML